MAALRKDYIGAVDLCRPDVADRKSRRTDGRPIHVIAGIAHMRLRAAAPKRSLWAYVHGHVARIRGRRQLALASSASLSSGILRGLDQFGRAAILLDKGERVLEANERGETLLGNGISIVDGRLAATSRDVNPEFQRLLNSATRVFQGEILGPMALPRLSRRPLIAHVAPIVRSGDEIFRRAKVLVMFVDPEEKKQTAAHLLRRAFGLTAAEASIALSISRGEDLRRAADVNRIALRTGG